MEQIKGFNEAYKKVKSMGFQNHFCMSGNTWKEAHDKFKSGMILKEKDYIMILEDNVKVVLALDKNKITFCPTCNTLWNHQEAKAGYKECEYCERKKIKNLEKNTRGKNDKQN